MHFVQLFSNLWIPSWKFDCERSSKHLTTAAITSSFDPKTFSATNLFKIGNRWKSEEAKPGE